VLFFNKHLRTYGTVILYVRLISRKFSLRQIQH